MEIVKREYIELDAQSRLSILIHALSKRGKSTLSATAPPPILVLDAEGSWRFIPVRKCIWNPLTEALPTYDGTWDVCIVPVTDWGTIETVYQWLTQQQTCFTSLVIDSITEIQRRCKNNMKGTEALKIQDWGILLAIMDKVLRGFRDITLYPSANLRCVVFVAETRRGDDGRYIPYMQGQIAVSIPYWVDICGYLYADYELDNNGQPTVEIRKLWIGPHNEFESGERVQGRLGYYQTIKKPDSYSVGNDITYWMQKIYS